MKRVPVIFAIDSNVVMQCGVTITSLLKNACPETFYEVFVLCNHTQLKEGDRKKLQDAFADSDQVSISFKDVGDSFKDTPLKTNGHITLATYYRLLIPELFPQFDKVIYADIDMIFQRDLSDLLETSFPDNELVAAVWDLSIGGKHFFKSDLPHRIGKSEKDYFNAGFLVMNLSQMRKENTMDEFLKQTENSHTENDQDVLNIVCKDRTQWLDNTYNFQTNHFSSYMWRKKRGDLSFSRFFRQATLHYTGPYKPWNSTECIAYDTWWHYYKQSPFYDDEVYFRRQQEQIEISRNDFRKKSNGQLFRRILVNIKHKLFG